MTATSRTVTRALGYVRVSTDDQAANGHGLDAQRAAIIAEADRRGWSVEIVADEGASGKHVNGGLRDCLDQLRVGRADALIVAKLDRLARSVRHAGDIIDAARDQGWNLVISDMGIDLATPHGRAFAKTLAVFAEFERELIGQRTREGLAAARAKGARIGRPRLAPAQVVERIVRRRDAGVSFAKIATELTGDGVLSPAGMTAWQPSTVRRVYRAATQEAVPA